MAGKGGKKKVHSLTALSMAAKMVHSLAVSLMAAKMWESVIVAGGAPVAHSSTDVFLWPQGPMPSMDGKLHRRGMAVAAMAGGASGKRRRQHRASVTKSGGSTKAATAMIFEDDHLSAIAGRRV